MHPTTTYLTGPALPVRPTSRSSLTGVRQPDAAASASQMRGVRSGSVSPGGWGVRCDAASESPGEKNTCVFSTSPREERYMSPVQEVPAVLLNTTAPMNLI
eukprot:1162070-Pelagomonas_calceolata.AAC.10